MNLDAFPHTFLSDVPLSSDRSLDDPKIIDELEKFQPDVVIGYGYVQKMQQRVKKWAKQHKSVHGRKILYYYISDSEMHHHESWLKRSLKSLYLPRYFSGIDRFLSVGNSNEFYYKKHGANTDSITRMHFSIDLKQYSLAYQERVTLRANARRDLGLRDNDFTLLQVGKLVEWKRQRDAMDAVAKLPEFLNARLMLAGSGPDETALKARAAQHAAGKTHFLGFVSPTELPAYYAAADAYVHCSSHEPHSLAISEAIYMGLPVLVSHSCGSYGPYDDVRPGSNGFVFRTGDLADLCKKIERLAIDPDLCQRFSRSSHDYAVEAQRRAHGQFLVEALTADGLL